MLAQLLGGLVGSALIYANYFHAIDIVEGGRGIRTLTTAGLFSTYAVSIPYNRLYLILIQNFADPQLIAPLHDKRLRLLF
jgi:hypothetical protein